MKAVIRVGWFGAFAFVSLLHSARASPSMETAMKHSRDAVASCIDAIREARTDVDFYGIDERIKRLPPMSKRDDEKWRRQRRRRLEMWLWAINKIDHTIDPNFNPADVPQMNVAPPVGAEVSAGASPRAIKDPKLRREYEEAVKANAQKADRYRLQYLLRRLDKQWSTQMLAFAGSRYTSNPEDVKEVRGLIDTILSNSQRKKQLKKELFGSQHH